MKKGLSLSEIAPSWFSLCRDGAAEDFCRPIVRLLTHEVFQFLDCGPYRIPDGLIPASFRCCNLLIGKPVEIVERQSPLLRLCQLCNSLM